MFRRVSCLTLTVLLLFCAVLPAFANDMKLEGMYVNTPNGKALNFRSSKSTRSDDNILDWIPYGTKVFVTNWDGTWATIKYNGATAYVVQKYLSIARPKDFSEVQADGENAKAAKELEKALKAENAKLDQSKVKKLDLPYDVTVLVEVEELAAPVYKKPSLLEEVLTRYESGTLLTVIAENKDWAEVYNGEKDETGYMLLSDLEADIMEEEVIAD